MPENIFYRAKRTAAALFSRRCVSCGKTFSGKQCLCAECTKKLKPVKSFFCEEYLACAAYSYEAPARDVMLRFKFNDDYESCIDTLSDWLCAGFDKYLSDESFDFAVSVPAFGAKPRMELFVRNFARRRGLCYRPELLFKIRPTEKQHRLSASERRTNLRGAFAASAAVCGKKILLIDDIYTTGSTVCECTRALCAAGASTVCVLTVLKTED